MIDESLTSDGTLASRKDCVDFVVVLKIHIEYFACLCLTETSGVLTVAIGLRAWALFTFNRHCSVPECFMYQSRTF